MVSQTLHYDIANVLLKTPSPPQTHNQHVHYIIKKISFTLHFWLLLRNLLSSHHLLENKKEKKKYHVQVIVQRCLIL